MCGLVGVMGNITHAEKKVFRDLLVFDQVRGTDSTGVIFVKDDGSYVIDKDLGTPHEGFFMYSNLFGAKGIPDGWNYRAMLGHNRAATLGKVTVKNAHPFITARGSFVGMHNGTLDIDQSVFEGKDDYEVDSEALLNAIALGGFEDTIPKTNGAWSLVTYDEDDKTVNLIRNSKRPMFYQFSEDEKTVFFASEAWMILAACMRHKVKLAGDGPIATDVDTMYSCDMSPKTFVDGVPFTYSSDKIEGKPTTYNYQSRWGGSWDGEYDEWGFYRNDSYKPPEHKSSDHKGKKTIVRPGGYRDEYEDGVMVASYLKDKATGVEKKIWPMEKSEEGKSSTVVPFTPKSSTTTKKPISKVYRELEDRDRYVQLFLPIDYTCDATTITMAELYNGWPCVVWCGSQNIPAEEIETVRGQYYLGKVQGFGKDAHMGDYDGYLIIQGNSLEGPFPNYGGGEAFMEDLKLRAIADREVAEEEWDDNNLIEGPFGVYVSVAEWKKEIKDTGCQICQVNDVDVKDAGEVNWIEGGGFTCPSCNAKQTGSN